MLLVFIFAKNFTSCNRLCIRINDFLPVRLIAIQIPVQINAADMHRKDIARLIGFCQFNPVLRLVRFWRIQQQINYFRRRCNRKIIAVFLFCTPLLQRISFFYVHSSPHFYSFCPFFVYNMLIAFLSSR